jgi:hypothetical protein
MFIKSHFRQNSLLVKTPPLDYFELIENRHERENLIITISGRKAKRSTQIQNG